VEHREPPGVVARRGDADRGPVPRGSREEALRRVPAGDGGGLAFAILILAGSAPALRAQDLAPRAYLVTPLRSHAVTLSNVFNDGHLLFDGAVPITGATGRLNVAAVSYYHAVGFFGRSANLTAVVGYGVGTFKGTVLGAETSAYRSGLLDAVVRFSVNVKGAPAMDLDAMRRWRQKTLLGASLKVAMPTGQYDPTKLINLGGNRWAVKPELGYSRRWGHWVLDAYAGVWFFTRNPEFFSRNAFVPGTQDQTQDPIAAFETHLSYDFRPRLWVSVDGNFWRGGRTSLNGSKNPATLQKSSRVGVTASFPLSRHQSVKVSFADGAYVRFGGDYRIASVAWQYSWMGKPD
jgi:outer membrane putative beta-barrel porin/alpha-amylase